MRTPESRKNQGLTLIELLVAVAISLILTAGIYRTFIGQHRTYMVQEQVVDMQQNVRVAINRMMREIRMAGFGNIPMVLPVQYDVYGQARTFNNVLNPDTPVPGSITIITATEDFATITNIDLPNRKVTVNRLTNAHETVLFDIGNKKYISVGGLEAHEITGIVGTELTLKSNLRISHRVNTPVFPIRAISYEVLAADSILRRDENIEGGRQPLAENIEGLRFEYFDADGNITAMPANIRMIRVTVTARTEMEDAELKKVEADGFRRRTIASNIHVRNMGLNP